MVSSGWRIVDFAAAAREGGPMAEKYALYAGRRAFRLDRWGALNPFTSAGEGRFYASWETGWKEAQRDKLPRSAEPTHASVTFNEMEKRELADDE